MNKESKTLQLNNTVKVKNNILNTYTTDGNSNLKRSYSTADSIIVKAKSVVTLTGIYK